MNRLRKRSPTLSAVNRTETLSLLKFSQLSESDRQSIDSYEIVPARLGVGSFGCVRVVYKRVFAKVFGQ